MTYVKSDFYKCPKPSLYLRCSPAEILSCANSNKSHALFTENACSKQKTPVLLLTSTTTAHRKALFNQLSESLFSPTRLAQGLGPDPVY